MAAGRYLCAEHSRSGGDKSASSSKGPPQVAAATRLNWAKIDPKTDKERDEIAYLVAHNFMEQIMADGFYHADPHAGNVMITEDNSIEWIDFGMMGTMTGSQRDTLKDLILALVKGDAYGMKRAVLKVATPTGPIDHAALLEMCEDITNRFIDVDLEEFDTGALITSLTKSCADVGMDIDPFLTNLGRGLVTLEGTIHHISPRLNIMAVLVDYLQSSFDPNSLRRMAADLAGKSIDSSAAMTALPMRIDQTLDMVQKGHVKLGMELSSNERFSKDIRAAAGLIALALVAVGLIIGAYILGSSANAVSLGGVPLFGGLGLIIGVVLALFVFVKIRPYLD